MSRYDDLWMAAYLGDEPYIDISVMDVETEKHISFHIDKYGVNMLDEDDGDTLAALSTDQFFKIILKGIFGTFEREEIEKLIEADDWDPFNIEIQ